MDSSFREFCVLSHTVTLSSASLASVGCQCFDNPQDHWLSCHVSYNMYTVSYRIARHRTASPPGAVLLSDPAAAGHSSRAGGSRDKTERHLSCICWPSLCAWVDSSWQLATANWHEHGMGGIEYCYPSWTCIYIRRFSI